ncbi:MAG: hypothetical protein JWO03_2779 [Bacteroidetes bacterium]|nr:hypothetical protein [Bacteroidota bacterium]
MKQNLRSLLLVLLSISISTTYGQIYSYTSNTTGAYNSIATNTTGVGLTRQNGATAPGSPCSTGFSSTSFSATTTYATSLGAVEAEVTADAGYELLVSGFSADLRRSGQGPASVRLAYSTDGGASWIDKGSNDAPNNSGCGSTTTASWSTGFIVGPSTPLKFRVYAFNATGASGTMQILNMVINGTVTAANTITTTAATFGPYCQNTTNTISVPFTSVGTFAGQFFVQLSDASGVFPNDATSNLISTGTTTSPASATIPSSTAAGSGYRVRVVNQSPTFYASGDNGSNIVINPTVVPAVTITDSPTAVCPGSPIRFSVGTSTGGGANPTYQWYVQGTSSGTGVSYTTSALSNNDSVYAVLTSTALCASPTTAKSYAIHVTVYSTQTTAIYDTICPGGSLVFGGNTQTATGSYTDHLQTIYGCDSAITLHLLVRSTVRDTATVNICQGSSFTFHGTTYSAAGVYSDTLSCDSIGSVHLIVNPKPTAVASLTGVANLTTTTFSTYQWLLNGAAVTGATSQNYTALQNGSYTVAVSDVNGCTDTSVAVAVTQVGIGNINQLNARIYPSPTEGIIYIDADGLGNVDIIDMIGRPVLSTEAGKTGSHMQIDLSPFSKGIYTVIMHGANNAISIKNITKQ